jgi:shikimate 5-dehydrogenase
MDIKRQQYNKTQSAKVKKIMVLNDTKARLEKLKNQCDKTYDKMINLLIDDYIVGKDFNDEI